MSHRALRYAIVTSQPHGYAGLFLHRLASGGAPHGTSAAAVIFCEARRPTVSRRRLLSRRVRKALRIGIIGTLNGLRMRRWYGEDLSARLASPEIWQAARAAGLPVQRIPSFSEPKALEVMRALELDVAVSMGNGYIASSFYQIPRYGMINIHHEWLPEYRGAQTAIWQIHDGSSVTGYTIHELSRKIDAGRILHREPVSIIFRPSLRETVVETGAEVQRRSLEGLAHVLECFKDCRAQAINNDGARNFTTPGTFALMRMLRNHHRLYAKQAPRKNVATT